MKIKTTFVGKNAESRVADFLKDNKFKILNQNWRTRLCEIDIVASKNNVVYFIEVKYRSSEKQGSGLEYITPKKLSQVQFAAEIWNQQNDWIGDYRILGAEVSDKDIKVIEIS
jgi:Holliday junction resolvase-like predicted endonuclease